MDTRSQEHKTHPLQEQFLAPKLTVFQVLQGFEVTSNALIANSAWTECERVHQFTLKKNTELTKIDPRMAYGMLAFNAQFQAYFLLQQEKYEKVLSAIEFAIRCFKLYIYYCQLCDRNTQFEKNFLIKLDAIYVRLLEAIQKPFNSTVQIKHIEIRHIHESIEVKEKADIQSIIDNAVTYYELDSEDTISAEEAKTSAKAEIMAQMEKILMAAQMLYQGNMYFISKEYALSLSCISVALEISKYVMPDALCTRSNIFFETQRYKECIEDCSVLVEISKSDARVYSHFLRAISYQELGDVESAQKDYIEAIRCENLTRKRFEKIEAGGVMAQLMKYEAKHFPHKNDLTKLTMDEKNKLTGDYFKQSQAAILTGRYDDAILYCSYNIQIDPLNLQYHLDRALAYQCKDENSLHAKEGQSIATWMSWAIQPENANQNAKQFWYNCLLCIAEGKISESKAYLAKFINFIDFQMRDATGKQSNKSLLLLLNKINLLGNVVISDLFSTLTRGDYKHYKKAVQAAYDTNKTFYDKLRSHKNLSSIMKQSKIKAPAEKKTPPSLPERKTTPPEEKNEQSSTASVSKKTKKSAAVHPVEIDLEEAKKTTDDKLKELIANAEKAREGISALRTEKESQRTTAPQESKQKTRKKHKPKSKPKKPAKNTNNQDDSKIEMKEMPLPRLTSNGINPSGLISKDQIRISPSAHKFEDKTIHIDEEVKNCIKPLEEIDLTVLSGGYVTNKLFKKYIENKFDESKGEAIISDADIMTGVAIDKIKPTLEAKLGTQYKVQQDLQEKRLFHIFKLSSPDEKQSKGFTITVWHSIYLSNKKINDPLLRHAENCDFTIKAIFADSEGNILRPLKESWDDLLNGVISTIRRKYQSITAPAKATEKSLTADPKRLLRAVECETKLNFFIRNKKAFQFKLDQHVANAIKDLSKLILTHNPGAINSFMKKLFTRSFASINYVKLRNYGIFSHFDPCLSRYLSKHVDDDLLRALENVKSAGFDLPIRRYYAFMIIGALCTAEGKKILTDLSLVTEKARELIAKNPLFSAAFSEKYSTRLFAKEGKEEQVLKQDFLYHEFLVAIKQWESLTKVIKKPSIAFKVSY